MAEFSKQRAPGGFVVAATFNRNLDAIEAVVNRVSTSLKLMAATLDGLFGKQGADVTAKAAIAMPPGCDFAKVSGAGNVDFIANAPRGTRFEFYAVDGFTANHATANRPDGCAAIITKSGAATAIAARGTLAVRHDGTNWVQV